MSFGIHIVEDTFSPKLANAPQRILQLVTEAMKRVGVDMVGYARALCPVRTGYLRSTIEFRVTVQLEADFGAYAYYSMYVEYGTFRMEARAFIRPTLDAYWTELQTAILQAVLEVFK